MDNLFKIIYNPSYLKPCLHYYHFMKIFDNEINKATFLKLIVSLNPKFVNMEPTIINPLFIRIIQNCFDIKYDVIKNPISYLSHINTVYSDYNEAKASIQTFIKPIETLDYKSIPIKSKTTNLVINTELVKPVKKPLQF